MSCFIIHRLYFMNDKWKFNEASEEKKRIKHVQGGTPRGMQNLSPLVLELTKEQVNV